MHLVDMRTPEIIKKITQSNFSAGGNAEISSSTLEQNRPKQLLPLPISRRCTSGLCCLLGSLVNQPRRRTNLIRGGFSDISINPRFSLLMELLYANKGYFTEVADVKTKYYFHYINLPVLLNYEIFENFSVGIGPEVGYLFAVTNEFREIRHTSTYKKGYESFDVGLDAGIEYKFLNNLKAGLRYNYGLTNIRSDERIIDENGNVLDAEPKMYNRVLQLYVGYTFKSRK